MTQKLVAPLAVAATAALALPAAAELKYENATGGSVKIYGQFSPAYQSVDDGQDRKNTWVDNAHSNTRVGLWVRQPDAGGEFSFNFETALGLRSSDGVSQTFTPNGAEWDRTKLRKIDFAYTSNSWGKISAGQGSMATDGVANADLGSNGMTTYNGIPDFAGDFLFRGPNGALSGVSISDAFTSLDGGRRARIRYDTPSFAGFSLSAAWGKEVLSKTNNDEYYDVALRYANDFNGTEVTGAIGFSRRDPETGGPNVDDTIGSFNVKLQSGLVFTVAGGSRKNSGSYGYGKVGYEADWLAAGATSFAVDYYRGSDFVVSGSESTAYGIGINQQVDSLNTQFYLGYRRHEYSEPGTDYADIDAILVGARWKF
ncbi:porin [Pukyongiella litopenaei]|uniref:Porin n=1 Tax=Pukyongiella litopenaei TaxID=2605946 RepID=A0A2S0MRW1_9RHOB|nr:porin [Pukyongiella litopenaei]AVO38481.1 porin [Pukyongiella litopenaei]